MFQVQWKRAAPLGDHHQSGSALQHCCSQSQEIATGSMNGTWDSTARGKRRTWAFCYCLCNISSHSLAGGLAYGCSVPIPTPGCSPESRAHLGSEITENTVHAASWGAWQSNHLPVPAAQHCTGQPLEAPSYQMMLMNSKSPPEHPARKGVRVEGKDWNRAGDLIRKPLRICKLAHRRKPKPRSPYQQHQVPAGTRGQQHCKVQRLCPATVFCECCSAKGTERQWDEICAGKEGCAIITQSEVHPMHELQIKANLSACHCYPHLSKTFLYWAVFLRGREWERKVQWCFF